MAEITAVLLNFLKAIGKYRWHAIVITWVVALIGWAVVLRLPNQYEASARVYVDTQSILKPLLSSMTTVPNLEQQVMFMRRTLISRPTQASSQTNKHRTPNVSFGVLCFHLLNLYRCSYSSQ